MLYHRQFSQGDCSARFSRPNASASIHKGIDFQHNSAKHKIGGILRFKYRLIPLYVRFIPGMFLKAFALKLFF